MSPGVADGTTGTGESGVTEQPAGKSEKQGSKSNPADSTGKDGKSKADPAPSGTPVVPSVTGQVTLPGGEKPGRTNVSPTAVIPPGGNTVPDDDPRADEENDLLNGLLGGSHR